MDADERVQMLLMQEELKRLNSPPYVSGTVLDIGKKTLRISVAGSRVIEISAVGTEKCKVRKGSSVILEPTSMALIGLSEFDKSSGAVVTVEEVLDNRLRVQKGGESLIVLNSVKDVSVGDEVSLDPCDVIALERFPKKKTKFALEEVSEVPWRSIGGLEETLRTIKQEVEDPFIHRSVFERYGRKPVKGILLYGPPGCGKTMIGRAIAYNLSKIAGGAKSKCANGHFIKINGPEILDKWVGNSEAAIRKIYAAARDVAAENGSPVIIFIDEAEAVLKTRGSGISTDVYDSIVPQFLAEMDGLNGHSNIITVLATNREDVLDPAVLRDGRVDRRIKVPRPSREGASEIFRIYLKGKPLQENANLVKLSSRLASNIYDDALIVYNVVDPNQGVLGNFCYRHLVSGAMIKSIVDRASNHAIQRELRNGTRGISVNDFDSAIKEELVEQAGFTQALARDDWDNVFGVKGKQYQNACLQGYLILENALVIRASHDGGTKNVSN
ncbi:AAA family ATPase [Candidatus Woesearchaeota archaeon]|nr:AAA family ATPase [Candidatus Woesearchaeota archaeon]